MPSETAGPRRQRAAVVDTTAPTEVRGNADFGEWARPSLLAMTRLARRLAPEADPEDVVQEALARAWRQWHRYDAARGSGTTWLLAITADQARAARRRRVRWRRVVDDSADVSEAATENADHADRLDVRRAMAALSERQRLAVDLHYFVGLSVAETAAVMRCSAGTVKSTLFDARRRMSTLLEETS